MATTGYSEACDIWSLGVMMYIMLCGYLPFNGANITGKRLRPRPCPRPRPPYARAAPQGKEAFAVS